MKKVLGMFVLIAVLMVTFIPVCAFCELPEAYGDEEALWDYLSEDSPSDYITAGIMGFFFRESRMKSDSVAGWPERNIGLDYDICEKFTEDIDAGIDDGSTRDEFIHTVNIHFGGYGLGQWSSIQYLEHFYDFIADRSGSIGDPELQCEFMFESLKDNDVLWEELLICGSATQCGRRIGYYYDGTGFDGSETIASIADIYYRKFSE